MRSKEVEKLAEEKRDRAKTIASALFGGDYSKVAKNYTKPTLIENLIDDIISAAILEISAIQLKTHEKSIFDNHLTNTGKLKRRIKNEL